MKGHEQSSGPSPTTGPEEAGSGAKGDKWRQFAIGVLPPWIVAPCRLLRGNVLCIASAMCGR